jgi:hypothetical protein
MQMDTLKAVGGALACGVAIYAVIQTAKAIGAALPPGAVRNFMTR